MCFATNREVDCRLKGNSGSGYAVLNYADLYSIYEDFDMKNAIALLAFVFAMPVLAAQDIFNVLSQDTSIVMDVRTEDNNVWIKLAPANLSDELTLRISNKNQDFYRSWFTGETDLVSSGFRGDSAWSDRVETSANYIEYWHQGVMVLHLERK
jgi:hypothetical protein